MRSNVATRSFVNIDPNTLELFIGNKRTAPMAIPLSDGNNLSDMTPMWNLTYYHFMYGVYGRRQQNLESGKRRAAQLSPPPPWLVALAAVMWEGIIQGATWDAVKLAASSAMAKLREAGIAAPASIESTTSLRAGWREYEKPGRKQYEMFLSLKRTVKTLPEGHAKAYARAKDQVEFGKMVRKQRALKDVPPRKTQ